VSYIKHMVCI